MARAVEEAAEALRVAILDGTLRPGSRLGEVELAEQLGVSRTPVREALRRLVAEGLVEVLPNRGARVVEWSAADLDEIYDLRALLESHGATRAATRISAGELPVLDKLCADMESCAGPGRNRDLDRLAGLNAEFHRRILDASGSARLAALVGTVVRVPLVLRTFHDYTAEALERSSGHHREIVAALRAGDPQWAGSVMRSHVLAARAVLVHRGES
jgi:DNA-binding GntR family transcriptional regulator